jgi:hypothetical protein
LLFDKIARVNLYPYTPNTNWSINNLTNNYLIIFFVFSTKDQKHTPSIL